MLIQLRTVGWVEQSDTQRKHRQSWVSLYSTQPTFGLETISNTRNSQFTTSDV